MSITSAEDTKEFTSLSRTFFDTFILVRAIWVASELGIADLLVTGAKTSDELAQATGVHAQSLYRVMRALASEGIFAEDEAGRFRLTPLAEQLCSDNPNSWRDFVNFMGSDFAYQTYGDILYSVQTGQPAFNHIFGTSIFQHLAKDPEHARISNDGMTSHSRVSSQFVLATYDFSGINKLVDVGGGHGFLIASILKAYPQMRGVLFDFPSVVQDAPRILEAHGVSDRCECVGGDFFTSVPEGGDMYLIKQILHSLPDEKILQLLQNIRKAMHVDGTLLQVDHVIPPGNTSSSSKFADLHMMVFTPSHERTEGEYRALYEKAGFNLTRVLHIMPSEGSILEVKRR